MNELTEKDVRRIVLEELRNNAKSGTPIIPRHNHDGNNSPQVSEDDLKHSVVLNGTIDMAQGTISGSYPNQVITWAEYILPISSSARSVTFYGGALDTTDSPKLHAIIIGEAQLTGGYQYQPGTSNSVIIGNVKVNIIQGSSSIIVTNGVLGGGPTLTGATSIIRNSQSYIAFASDASNNIYAVARVYSFDNTKIVVQTAFATNWSLSGLWTIK